MDTDQSNQLMDDAVNRVRQDMQALQSLLIETCLKAEYRDRTAALDDEDATKSAEVQSLQQAYVDLKPVAEANVKKLNDEATDLMAQARKDESAAKTEEARAVQRELDEIPEKVKTLETRRLDIAEEKRQIARQLFREQHPLMQRSAHSVIEGVLDFLDELKSGFYAYATEETDAQGQFPYFLVRQMDVDLLVPQSGQLMRRMDTWFADKR